ncbi:allantoin racemase [Jatrophihabitans sp. GAS493]|uniref:aspartate/glutamate racemase family protein n=1 Tax=Jatrophihabitans sp. GAS493 TaxID=1907575 RepID=UPI000BC0ECBB|nr:aspartate/glutamate racemase family protein [Jatrophihabitans sp. GAS493]SOD74821.1 allantoin racemase [Jatrophihabitans sp. GAS493]
MSRRIMVVNPNTTRAMTDAVVAAAASVAAPGTELLGATPTKGVSSVESHVDEVWGAVGVLEEIRRGEELGVDGYVVACFGDTGVPAAREVATGPVVGMTEAALMTAALLAHRFSIVTMPRRTMEQSDRVLRTLGLDHRCSVRAVEVAVAEVEEGSTEFLELFADEARAAIADDDAEAIVLGCSGLTDLVAPLRHRLGVPVIDGVLAAVTMVEGLLAQGLTTSRANTFARPSRLEPKLEPKL